MVDVPRTFGIYQIDGAADGQDFARRQRRQSAAKMVSTSYEIAPVFSILERALHNCGNGVG